MITQICSDHLLGSYQYNEQFERVCPASSSPFPAYRIAEYRFNRLNLRKVIINGTRAPVLLVWVISAATCYRKRPLSGRQIPYYLVARPMGVERDLILRQPWGYPIYVRFRA